MDALQPAAALAVQPPQQLRIEVDLVFPHRLGQGSLLADNRPHRVRADLELPTDLALRRPRQVQLVNRLTLVRIDHEVPSSFRSKRATCSTDPRSTSWAWA